MWNSICQSIFMIKVRNAIYRVTENFIVNPDEVWVLKDFGDNRVTLITCTDDGTQRQVVVGKLSD